MKITLQRGDILTYRYFNGVMVSLAYDPIFDGGFNEVDTENTLLIKIQRGNKVLYRKKKESS